jgi:general secretion pathway protein I
MKKQEGFSLLEVLVAFSILSMSLGVLLKTFSSGLFASSRIADHYQAAHIAENLVSSLGEKIPLEVGTTTGDEKNGFYRWEINISPWQPEAQPENLSLLKIDVRVGWGKNSRNLLSTLRFQPENNRQ